MSSINRNTLDGVFTGARVFEMLLGLQGTVETYVPLFHGACQQRVPLDGIPGGEDTTRRLFPVGLPKSRRSGDNYMPQLSVGSEYCHIVNTPVTIIQEHVLSAYTTNGYRPSKRCTYHTICHCIFLPWSSRCPRGSELAAAIENGDQPTSESADPCTVPQQRAVPEIISPCVYTESGQHINPEHCYFLVIIIIVVIHRKPSSHNETRIYSSVGR